MKDPAFLFYSSDFLTGVTDLTMEERGQYITLLCIQHQKGHLTEKTIRLSVGSISVDVRNKFSLDDEGNLFNEILEKHIEERKKFTESRRNNGLKGGRPKKENKPIGLPSENLHENENININIKKGIEKKDDYYEQKFKEYSEHIKQQSVMERIGMNCGLIPNQVPILIDEFLDQCYGSIIEENNKFKVENYFMNWVKKPGKINQALTNQTRKNGKKKQ